MLQGYLSLVLVLFLVCAVVSFLDHTLWLFFQRHDLSLFSALLFLVMLLFGFTTYCVIALVPAVPKRWMLPVSLFLPVGLVAILPWVAVKPGNAMWVMWGFSLCHVLVAVFLLCRLQGGLKWRWPLFPLARFTDRRFHWGNLLGVLLAGLLVLLPALATYAGYSLALAVNHLSDGFISLRPSGLVMQVRKYVRDDGKSVLLVPMSHVGEPEFYHHLSESFPEDSTILMEGVTDRRNLIKRKVGYNSMAKSLGVVEQQVAFKPKGERVSADMDLSDLSPATVDLVDKAMLFHSQGMTAKTLPILMEPMPAGLEKELMENLLDKRNDHLLRVLGERLAGRDHFIIPWGAAHMPGIARGIEKLGFRKVESHDRVAIRFGS
jgi:hypothetical protein